MYKKKLGYQEAYSIKTPGDSKRLYRKWAKTYDKDFAINSNYVSPKKISTFFNKYAKITDTPILDVGAGTGLVAEFLNQKNDKKIIGIDISSEMLKEAKRKGCYTSVMVADVTKKIRLKKDSIGAIVSAGTFTHGHIGPNVFDELLRIIKPGGLFVLSINSKYFIEKGFKKKFLKIKNKITTPKFIKYSAHGNNRDKKFSKIKIFAAIFRKKKIKNILIF